MFSLQNRTDRSLSVNYPLVCASHYLIPLSSAKASLCCREAGEKEKRERTGHDEKRELSIFYYCYFYRDTQREPLRRREI